MQWLGTTPGPDVVHAGSCAVDYICSILSGIVLDGKTCVTSLRVVADDSSAANAMAIVEQYTPDVNLWLATYSSGINKQTAPIHNYSNDVVVHPQHPAALSVLAVPRFFRHCLQLQYS